MIVNMMIVLELECLVSRQWQEQIRSFQLGPAAGRVQLEKNLWVQEYTGISGYIVPQTLHHDIEHQQTGQCIFCILKSVLHILHILHIILHILHILGKIHQYQENLRIAAYFFAYFIVY